MITPNPILGIATHAIGGVSAASCYMPFEKVRKWSWGIFWIVQALFAWLIMPLVIGYFTVPDLFEVLKSSPSPVFWGAFGLGAIYGFGGLSFGYAIREIGYSLTYTISIGISAVLGTIIPLIIDGQLISNFTKPGGGIVLLGMVISILGVSLCGRAGFMKERHLSLQKNSDVKRFKMNKGLLLTLIAGTLSAIWGVSLSVGQPISDIAAQHGAGHFEGNAKLIVSSLGCLMTNLIWFGIATIKDGSIKMLFSSKEIGMKQHLKNYSLSMLAGSFWYLQFFFYGLGHVRMGNFQFASWVIHMSMLIFFSYIIGVIMKEWKNVDKKTKYTLMSALLILVISFVVMTYGSYIGEMPANH